MISCMGVIRSRKLIFQKIHSGYTFENGFKGGKIRYRVNCEAVVVDENDNEDGDSMADTVLVIVVHDVIEF